MIQLCVTTLGKGITIACESCLNLNHFGSSVCRLSKVRLSKHRYYKYMFARYQRLLDKFDQQSAQQVYIQTETRWHDPQINFVFSDKRALDAVRFRHFYKDCLRLAGDIAELNALAEQECSRAIEFLDRNYRDILDNFDPTVTRLRKKRKIIFADGALDDIL